MSGLRSAVAWCRRRWYVVAALVFVLIGAVWLGRSALNDGAERRASRARIERSADEAKSLAAQVLGLTSQVKAQNDLLLSVTGPEAQARQAAATRDILSRNAIELDCRGRRQQVRLPAPDPARSCAEQTDPSVYPGVAGEPSKGP